MTKATFTTPSYQGQDRQISWIGICMDDGDNFSEFMTNDVASRLYDEEGRTAFEHHLRDLATTEFARNNLNAILTAEVPEERSWAIGEAIAEAYLAHEYQITWPWNMERDKRNPQASLPGADLVGFRVCDEGVCLVLGEVKTSTDANTPPSVMRGRSGMTNQIDNLANNLSLIFQLLKWLLPRCKGTAHEESFNVAVRLFLDSGNTTVALFGVLIRDTQPNVLDLQASGTFLAGKLQNPTICHLVAIYLPCAIADLPSRIMGGES